MAKSPSKPIVVPVPSPTPAPPATPAPQRPVPSYGFSYIWSKAWEPIFDAQVQLIREDIHRGRSEDKLIIYLSCPISSRGGGNAATNVEIARASQNRILSNWGHRVWVLNPAMYQMESKSGAGLMNRHAQALGIALPETAPSGGDYMRMWSKVLIEEDLPLLVDPKPHPGPHLGGRFDGYYFLGPSDVHYFFTHDASKPLTDAIEEYFARKLAQDADFRDDYTESPAIEWGKAPKNQTPAEKSARDAWEERRRDFFRYYALRAGASFSLGSHDEWNILLEINRRRIAQKDKAGLPGIGNLLSAWFDGRQVPLGASEQPASPGYDLAAETSAS